MAKPKLAPGQTDCWPRPKQEWRNSMILLSCMCVHMRLYEFSHPCIPINVTAYYVPTGSSISVHGEEDEIFDMTKLEQLNTVFIYFKWISLINYGSTRPQYGPKNFSTMRTVTDEILRNMSEIGRAKPTIVKKWRQSYMVNTFLIYHDVIPLRKVKLKMSSQNGTKFTIDSIPECKEVWNNVWTTGNPWKVVGYVMKLRLWGSETTLNYDNSPHSNGKTSTCPYQPDYRRTMCNWLFQTRHSIKHPYTTRLFGRLEKAQKDGKLPRTC